jgi:WD40 repeat protein
MFICEGNLSRERDVLRGHEGWVWCCAISHNDEFIVSGSKDNKIKIWEIESGNCVKTFDGHSSYVTCVCISNDDRYIISGKLYFTLKIIRVDTVETKSFQFFFTFCFVFKIRKKKFSEGTLCVTICIHNFFLTLKLK